MLFKNGILERCLPPGHGQAPILACKASGAFVTRAAGSAENLWGGSWGQDSTGCKTRAYQFGNRGCRFMLHELTPTSTCDDSRQPTRSRARSAPLQPHQPRTPATKAARLFGSDRGTKPLEWGPRLWHLFLKGQMETLHLELQDTFMSSVLAVPWGFLST